MKEAEIFQLLHDIENGKVSLNSGQHSVGLSDYYGTRSYTIDNGWKLWIFFDCGEWDYLERVLSPQGESLDYDNFSQRLRSYTPPENIRETVYQAPGYLGCCWEDKNGQD